MNSRRILVAVVGAATVGSAVAALSAQGQSGTTLTFNAPAPGARDVRELDLRPHGSSLGDELIAAQSLRAQGRLAGRVEVVCTITDLRFEGRQCLVTLVLRDGVVAAQNAGLDRNLPGTSPTRTADVFAVTGGTGAYNGASGTITIRHKRGGDVMTVALEP